MHDEEEVMNEILPPIKKNSIETKTTEYINSFTVHGLTRIFTTSKFESLFWLFILICGVILASYIIHGRLSKYYQFDIYTEISSKITNKNNFPTIAFCEANLLVSTFFSYCGQNIGLPHELEDKECPYKDASFKERDMNVYKNTWSNGIFNVTSCRTWGGKECVSAAYLKPLTQYNQACIAWNYDGNLYDIYGHVEIEFHFVNSKNSPYAPKVYAIPHDPRISEIDLTKKVNLDPAKIYDVRIDKSIVKRLTHPYPSNCTNGKASDIFPGKYSRRACIESHNYINMYKECGDTLDYIRKYIPEEIKKKYGKKHKISQVKQCIIKFSQKETTNVYNCPFPCESLDISVLPTFHDHLKETIVKLRNHSYFINVQFEHVDSIKTIEEKELYSWYQMTCEIGGFVGLVIGASLISCIEILACLSLYILRKCS